MTTMTNKPASRTEPSRRTELANLLDGRKCGKEITEDECIAAAVNRLVVILVLRRTAIDALGMVFGYSDDTMAIRGAVCEDIASYYISATVYFDKNGLIECSGCHNQYCHNNIEMKEHGLAVDGVDAPRDAAGHVFGEFRFLTDIPHDTFLIMDAAGDVYCQGIVFELADVCRANDLPLSAATEDYT